MRKVAAWMADRIGQQLGNYTIIQLLGQGGFAEVYLGEHLYLKSQAAIKVLQTRLSAQDDMESFLREAQTIARLSHPNIIRVLDFGVASETPFLVMDYAPNGTLRQRYTKGVPVPLPTIIPHVQQVADALQYAHDEHLIHRDIKPENMLIGRRNEILLSDFGIALVSQSSRFQGTQDVVGTVAYMAPEQLQGKPRPASDQYSLGIVIYEWLTGERPFQGTFTEVCTQQMFAPPPPLRQRLTNISPEVERILMKALDKDPKQRFESVKLFAAELERVSDPLKTGLMQPTSNSNAAFSTVPMPEDGSYATRLMTQNSAHPSMPPLSPNPSQAQQSFPANSAQFNRSSSIQPAQGQPGATLHSAQTTAQTGYTPNAPQQSMPGAQPFPARGQQQPQAPAQFAPNQYNPNQRPGSQQYAGANNFQQNQRQQPYPAYNGPQQQPPSQADRFGQQAGLQSQRPSWQEQEDHPPRAAAQQSPERTDDSSEHWWDMLGTWKRPVFATIIGIILTAILFDIRPDIYNVQQFGVLTLPAVLLVPLFFGGAFGPWVGLCVGFAAALCGSLFYSDVRIFHETLYPGSLGFFEWWNPYLYFLVAGFAPGLSMLLKIKKYPTISSVIRATILSIIGMAAVLGLTLYNAHELRRFPHAGITLLVTIAISFVLLIVYSIVGRLIDAG
jgi:serine/threonine protein kinase